MAFDYSANVFNDELLEGENILWSGQPEMSHLFTGADLFLIPFGLYVCWSTLSGFVSTVSSGLDGGAIFFSLLMIPFVGIGLYMLFGRFIYKQYKKKRTFYAVTNKRVLVLSIIRNRNIVAAWIDRIPFMNKAVHSDGVGTIIFGNVPQNVSGSMKFGMDIFTLGVENEVPVFADVDDAQKVYQLVNDLHQKGVVTPS
jgi:hypothetical protein